MAGFFENLGSNLLADLLFWLGLGLIVWLTVRLTQRRFLDFFGVRESRRLTVHLSNLWDPRRGDPQGSVLAGHEFRVIRTVAGLFGDAPFRLPDLVRGLVDSFFLGQKVDFSVEVSPLSAKEIGFSDLNSLMIVGATPKNSVRRHYFESGLPYLTVVGEAKDSPDDIYRQVLSPRVRVMKGPQKDGEIIGPYNFAIVEKTHDGEHGMAIFMCVGFRGDSSWGATEYLAKNWRELSREYGDKDFALCLGFPMSERRMHSYVEPTVVARSRSDGSMELGDLRQCRWEMASQE
jgi:hypothetical protein